MTWFWLNVPAAAAFFVAWTVLPEAAGADGDREHAGSTRHALRLADHQ